MAASSCRSLPRSSSASAPNPIASVFTWRPLVLLGQASYCLFLLHFNFINILRLYHVTERMHLAALDPWITYAATALLAFAAYYLVEEPPARPFCAVVRPPPGDSPTQKSPRRGGPFALWNPAGCNYYGMTACAACGPFGTTVRQLGCPEPLNGEF